MIPIETCDPRVTIASALYETFIGPASGFLPGVTRMAGFRFATNSRSLKLAFRRWTHFERRR